MKSIWEFYAFVEELIPDLREAGESAAADRVDRALRGGATSGEILGDLWIAMNGLEDGAVDSEGVRNGLAFIRNALGPAR